MRKIYFLLLMVQFVSASRNLNQILDRGEWISIAKEYIRNHKPYKVKNYELYKPRVVNITNSIGGEFRETTVSPDETTNHSTGKASTTEPTFLPDSTTISEDTDFMETTTTAFESSTATWSTTEILEITTESPETTTFIETTTSRKVYETDSTTLESLVDLNIAEAMETTTEVLLSTTESPEISTSTDAEFGNNYSTTEPVPSTVWPWFSSTQSSDITTERIITETSTYESTTSESLKDQSTETSTTLLNIISTTPGFETTTTYLDTAIDSTEAINFTTETTPPGFHFTNQIQEATTEAFRPTTTTRRASIVEDSIRQKKRKIKYTSDTEPEISWD